VPKVNKQTIALINDIIDSSKTIGGGVNALQVRASNDDKIALLDRLERDGYLRKENDKYWLTLTSLMLLDKKKKQKILDNFERLFSVLKTFYKSNQTDNLNLNTLSEMANISTDDVRESLSYMIEGSWWSGHNDLYSDDAFVKPSESILTYNAFSDVIKQIQGWQAQRVAVHKKRVRGDLIEPLGIKKRKMVESTRRIRMSSKRKPSLDIWAKIENDYGIDKRAFGKKIHFVNDQFKRKVIFRDVEHSYHLACEGFSKPSVILAGGVVEELLRIYLQHKKVIPQRDNFDEYIKACDKEGLLKSAIHRLTDSVRHFRNIVHLEKESSARATISKAAAKGAVASIFTIVNDL
jgi:hypothetical protein